MSEEQQQETVGETEGQETPQTETAAVDSGPERLPDDHPLVKSLERYKGEAKELRSKVKEFEDRDKSDQERASEKAAEAEKRAAEAESRALRYEVAIEKGVPQRLMRFLNGSTKKELEEQAAELLEAVGTSDAPSRRPKERLKPGASTDSEPQPDPKKIAEQVMSSGF